MSGRRHRAILTGSPLSSATARWTQPGFVKSVQRNTITIANGTASNTATITAVDPSNALLVYLGILSGTATSNLQRSLAYLTFTNSTTITATKVDLTEASTVGFEVVEFFPGVLKQVQRGIITIANTASSSTATITTGNVAKTSLTNLGWNVASNTQVNDNILAKLILTNLTTITANRTGTDAALIVAYQAAEYF